MPPRGFILVVEDDLHLMEGIQEILELDGYEVATASSGVEGLEFLRKSEVLPDIVISDVMMPRMSGYEFLEAIRSEPNWKGIPFIFLTAKGEKSDVQLGASTGADAYVPKPFGAWELLKTVDTQISLRNNPQFRSQAENIRVLICSDMKYFPAFMNQIFFSYSRIPVTRQNIASSPSRVIAVIDNLYANILSDVKLIKSFALSSSLPLVVASVNINDRAALFDAGANIVCGSDDNIEVLTAIRKAYNLQQAPPLIPGTKWLILLITHSKNFYDTIYQILQKHFLVDILIANGANDVFQIAHEYLPDLILVDDAIQYPDAYSLLGELCQLDLPTIVFTESGSERINQQLNRLNINDYILKSDIDNRLILTLERLSRWMPQAPVLTEEWASSTNIHVETRFELLARKKKPKTATRINEFSILGSGLIHDLRNALIGLKLKLPKVSETSLDELSNAINNINFLFECIAATRFKGNWHPTQLPDKHEYGLSEVIQEALKLAQLDISLGEFTPPVLIADKEKLTYAITILVKFTQPQKIEVECKEKLRRIRIIFKDTYETPKNLVPIFRGKTENLFALAAYKFLHYHSAKIIFKKNEFVILLPMGSWPSDMILRQQIAILADDIDAMKEKIATLPDLPTGVNISPLISAAAKELVAALQKFIRLVMPLGEAGLPLLSTGRYALLLARDMLAVSEQIKPTLQTVSLKRVIAQLLDIRKNYLRGIKVEVALHPETIAVHGDELGLLQILVNLVTNAVEAMRGEGKITIRASAENQTINLQVSDTGSGISPENLDKIFALFFTTKIGHERGVGLHVVASLVQQMNGSVRVDSVVGQGTTFTIKLPMAEEK